MTSPHHEAALHEGWFLYTFSCFLVSNSGCLFYTVSTYLSFPTSCLSFFFNFLLLLPSRRGVQPGRQCGTRDLPAAASLSLWLLSLAAEVICERVAVRTLLWDL